MCESNLSWRILSDSRHQSPELVNNPVAFGVRNGLRRMALGSELAASIFMPPERLRASDAWRDAELRFAQSRALCGTAQPVEMGLRVGGWEMRQAALGCSQVGA